MTKFGSIVRSYREGAGVQLRKVAAFVDIDQAILSKIERGQRRARREQVELLADFFKVDREELLVAWLADKVVDEMKDEELALKALMVAGKEFEYRASKNTDRKLILDTLKKGFRHFPQIEKAWIFGSFARGEENNQRDIDVLIDVAPETKFTLFDMADIEDHLQRELGQKVAVVMLNGIKPEVKDRIKNEMQLIYGAGQTDQ